MGKEVVKARKYQDAEGNVFATEKSARNGKWIVTRTNVGGNRKIAKGFETCAFWTQEEAQRLLDRTAENVRWKEV